MYSTVFLGMSQSSFFAPDPNLSHLILSICWYQVPILDNTLHSAHFKYIKVIKINPVYMSDNWIALQHIKNACFQAVP